MLDCRGLASRVISYLFNQCIDYRWPDRIWSISLCLCQPVDMPMSVHITFNYWILPSDMFYAYRPFQEELSGRSWHIATWRALIYLPFSKYVKLPEERFHAEFACLDVGIYYPLVSRRGNETAFAMENHRAKKFVSFGLSSNIIYKWGTLW